MKKLLFPAILVFMLISCKNHEGEMNAYYIEFQLNKSDGNTNDISLGQIAPKAITGNGIKNGDSVSVGFEILNSFPSPTDSHITQLSSFNLSMLLSAEEFNVDSGTYHLKNPSDFQSYIPTGNLFEENNISISTYFHEDDQTFCSALLDTTFANYFKITQKRYYTDENGEDAMDLIGEFNVRYNSMCDNGDTELNAGKFKVKLLLREF